MLKRLVYLFTLLKFLQGNLLDVNNICNLNDFTMHCQCKNHENITLTTSVHFDIKNIKIEGCYSVDIPLGAMSHLQLEELLFSDITNFQIKPFALIGMQILHSLTIQNVRKFTVLPHGFAGLKNVKNVVIRNIVTENLFEGSLAEVIEVEKFWVENSYFGDVQTNTFFLRNITSVSFVNCTFNNIDSNSFVIHMANDLFFSNCKFQNVSFDSIQLWFVEGLTFDKCSFEILENYALHTNDLKNFIFKECEVSQLKYNSFASVNASENFSFTHNSIKLADRYSLNRLFEYLKNEDIVTEYCCNYFTCDCNIHWLWNYSRSVYTENFIKESYCIGIDNTYVSDMVPIFDSHDNCKTLENNKFLSTVISRSEVSNGIIHEISAISPLTFYLIFTYLFQRTFFYYV